MDSWKHCPDCNTELKLLSGHLFSFYCPKCDSYYSRPSLEMMYDMEMKKKRLAAVRELVAAYLELADENWADGASSSVIGELSSVWPEATKDIKWGSGNL